MGYDFAPTNDIEGFYLGAFSWPILAENCFGSYFTCIHKGARWFFVKGVDERMGDEYPLLISNDNFPVTAEESLVIARMVRNYVAMQRSLSDDQFEEEKMDTPDYARIWPFKMRTDFVDKFEKFADWAERSGGFTIG